MTHNVFNEVFQTLDEDAREPISISVESPDTQDNFQFFLFRAEALAELVALTQQSIHPMNDPNTGPMVYRRLAKLCADYEKKLSQINIALDSFREIDPLKKTISKALEASPKPFGNFYPQEFDFDQKESKRERSSEKTNPDSH